MSRVADAEGRFLQLTLATSFEPGTNRKGAVLGAAWTLLLPSLELGHVLCLGLPAPRTLATLAHRATRLSVVCAGERDLRRARKAGARAGVDVELLRRADLSSAGDVSLAVIADEHWARHAGADPALAGLLDRAGSVFADLDRTDSLPAWAMAAQPLWLESGSGEVHKAAGLQDDAVVALLERPAAAVTTAGRRGLRAQARALAKRARDRGRTEERRGLLIAGDGVGPGPGAAPPAYVRAIAAAAGTPVDDCRVGLVAPPDYPSRKAILFLLEPGADAPRYVVKLTRDPAFNDRLENEWRVLSLLADAGIGDADTVPRPVFLGHEAGLAVLGETSVAGTPFRQRTTATADCPLAWSGIAWLEELAAATADRAVAGNAAIAAGLRQLLDRFTELYGPTPDERAVLAALVERVAGCAAPMPLVFQHGDPGTWNLLVTGDGRPAFLDWEAAEPQGMPLWDLFYFVRSFGITVARAGGTRSSQKAFAEQFLADTPMSRGLADLVERHCARIDLDRTLVEPLFYTCWMHRALKEAMRLGPEELSRGRYFSLLRMCLARRDAPALRRVLADAP
jgi:phosphotransferase family enzyme